MCGMQAPYNVEVVGPTYLSLLEIANAEEVGNITDGTLDLRVTEQYQNLEPDFGNMVNVTLTLATSSQVSSWVTWYSALHALSHTHVGYQLSSGKQPEQNAMAQGMYQSED